MTYEARVIEKIDNGKGYWRSTLIGVFKDGEQVGEYVRNYDCYSTMTFAPFTKNGKDYALYSPDYTCTRVMKLPECEDIGGEDPDGHGFCPVQLYVPTRSWLNSGGDYLDRSEKIEPEVGFVAGCRWGDDSSWKIQAIDLRRVEEGIINRDNRLGHVELPEDHDLDEVVTVKGGGWVYVLGNVVARPPTDEEEE